MGVSELMEVTPLSTTKTNPEVFNFDVEASLSSRDWVVNAQHCWLSTSVDSGAEAAFQLIQDGCVVSNAPLTLLNNGVDHRVQFAYQVSPYLDSLGALYVHCELHVCDTG